MRSELARRSPWHMRAEEAHTEACLLADLIDTQITEEL